MGTRLLILIRLRSKLLRVRHLSRTWVRIGGDVQPIVQALTRFNYLVGRHRLRAGEQELDSVIARLRQQQVHHHVDKPAA